MSSRFKIPILDLKAHFREIRSEVQTAIDEVLDDQQFILGPAVSQFEAQMVSYLGCGHAVGVASGSDALLLALMGLGIGRGDAVVVPPFTFFSTVSAITRVGAKPFFVDIDPDDFLISAEAVERFFAHRVRRNDGRALDVETGLTIKAILPVHLFGRCCSPEKFLPMARQFDLRVVEDVAQACGARSLISGQERFAGAVGDAGCFSFFPSKTLGGLGDGGLLTTNDAALAARFKTLRMHGEAQKYHHRWVGINSRLDSLQAAVLSVKQRHLNYWCDQRMAKAQVYHHLFVQSDLLGEDKVIAIPACFKGRDHVFNNYVVRVHRRDELKDFLAERGIQSEVYYPLPLHLQECFADLGYKTGDFPAAELAARQVLALPLYPEIAADQQECVVSAIRDFFCR